MRRGLIPSKLTDLTFEQQFGHFGCDLFRALVQLRIREIGDRMGHGQEAKSAESPGARHRAAGSLEYVGDDRCRGYAMLFKYDTVEHTARAA
jgi:hypothetical protein